MSDEPQAPTNSSRFRKMADSIDHNKDVAGFGGAAVIVIPGHDSKVIELLILDNSQDPAQFLATIGTRIAQIVQELNDQARMQSGYR